MITRAPFISNQQLCSKTYLDDNVPNLENVNMNSPSPDNTMRLAAITRKTVPPMHLERLDAVWRNCVGIFFFQMALASKEAMHVPPLTTSYTLTPLDKRINRNDYLF